MRKTLDSMVKVFDVTFDPGAGLRYIHKVYQGRDVYFFANLSKNPISTQAKISGRLTPEMWNPHTGEICSTKPEYTQEDNINITKVKLKLEPLQSVFVIAKQ